METEGTGASQRIHPGTVRGVLTGLGRDIDKCKDTMGGTATSGLKAGFAREWRATFAANLKHFQTHNHAIEELKDDDATNANVLSFYQMMRSRHTSSSFSGCIGSRIQGALLAVPS